MSEKVIVMHDASVYTALRRQAKINRRFALFAVVVSAYLIFLTKTRVTIEESKTAEE